MQDITEKSTTLRIAKAQATVTVSDIKTIETIQNNAVPKGNIFEFAKVAAMFGVKKTAELIPDCHPLPIESCKLDFKIDQLNIFIEIEVKTIYRTGVEVEAMHGASIAALTMYDMLKPIDKGVVISNISLVSKKGGKSDFHDKTEAIAMVVVCSDTIFAGKKEDFSGKIIVEQLKKYNIDVSHYEIIPDEAKKILEMLDLGLEKKVDYLIYTGGTGLSPRDITPETLEPHLERLVPGIMEAARAYGQERMPYAMVSRSIAGYKKNTLVLTLPGSKKGAKETMQALFPYLLHLLRVKAGAQHNNQNS